MKLGSLKTSTRDGILVVVSQNNKWFVPVPDLAPTMQSALDDWNLISPKLKKIYDDLNSEKISEKMTVNEVDFHCPLPRSYAWIDGSAFIEHIILVRKTRGAQPPETLKTIPLMYQGGSDDFIPPRGDIQFINADYGLDFEAEVGVVLTDTPMGINAKDALKHICLLVIINDVTLRGLVPFELGQGFGFFQSKPSSSFAPFAISPDELGDSWKDGRVHLPLLSEYNQKFFGCPNAGEMYFNFGELIAHAARTRNLRAGTILGSGTVSNSDRSKGSSCLAEKRMIEKIEKGNITTEFMQPGDQIKIYMNNPQGKNLFGTIDQKVI